MNFTSTVQRPSKTIIADEVKEMDMTEPTKELKTKPTKEQLQKFWECCGFNDLSGRTIAGDSWQYPNGGKGRLPAVDLNNLYKWAVLPAIQKIMDIYSLTPREAMTKLFTLWLEKFWGQIMSIEDALFWVIWEVIGGNDETG